MSGWIMMYLLWKLTSHEVSTPLTSGVLPVWDAGALIGLTVGNSRQPPAGFRNWKRPVPVFGLVREPRRTRVTPGMEISPLYEPLALMPFQLRFDIQPSGGPSPLQMLLRSCVLN